MECLSGKVWLYHYNLFTASGLSISTDGQRKPLATLPGEVNYVCIFPTTLKKYKKSSFKTCWYNRLLYSNTLPTSNFIKTPAACSFVAFNRQVSSNDYPSLDTLTKSIVKEKQPFVRLVMTKEHLLEMFKVTPYDYIGWKLFLKLRIVVNYFIF